MIEVNAVATLRHFFTAQFLRFTIVGSVAAGLNWYARFLLNPYMNFSAAVVLAYCVGVISAFALNRVFVFPNAAQPMIKQVTYFVAINLAFFPVVWGAAMLLSSYILPGLGVVSYKEGIGHAIAIAIPVFVTFLFHKFKTFGASST